MALSSYITRTFSALHINMATLFKLFLLGGMLIVSGVFITYTFNVIGLLQVDTRQQVQKYVRLWQMTANSPTSTAETQFIFEEIIVKANFPIIILNSDRKPIHWRNVEGAEPTDTTAATYAMLQKIADKMVADNGEYPLYFAGEHVNYFCYGDSDVIEQLKRMPFIEIGIVLAFVIVGIIGFQNIRKSEERHIWVGMAKETAHQLGTPISSLLGWVEVLEMDNIEEVGEDAEENLLGATIFNMKKDLSRLQQVAHRFGLIGSVPELHRQDIDPIIMETAEYYRRRVPFEGKGIQISYVSTKLPEVDVNPELFGWVLENLLKNALQAVDSRTGRIDIKAGVNNVQKVVILDITDNGHGISPVMSRKIFRAGMTTKKRGWGLGLTLAQRIVEDYHGGRITLKKSQPGETTFEIILPISDGMRG